MVHNRGGAIKNILGFKASCFADLEMKTHELKQILPISVEPGINVEG